MRFHSFPCLDPITLFQSAVYFVAVPLCAPSLLASFQSTVLGLSRSMWVGVTFQVCAISSTVVIATMYGNYNFAIKLGPIDTVFKSLNYYLHELAWDQIKWGVASKRVATDKAT